MNSLFCYKVLEYAGNIIYFAEYIIALCVYCNYLNLENSI